MSLVKMLGAWRLTHEIIPLLPPVLDVIRIIGVVGIIIRKIL